MNKPNFQCGAYNVNPEHPSTWDIPPKSAISTADTLGGVEVKDVPWRKYVYRLTWEAMSLSDFEALEDLVNYHNDNAEPILFQYDKFHQTEAAVEVSTPPLQRSKRGGSGADVYFQNVTIVLTEINPR